MFEMASNGAKVLQSRCVELAMRHQVCLRVLSTFVPLEQILLAPCTQIGDKKMEDIRFVGLTHLTDEMLVSIKFCDKKMMRDFWDFAKNSGIDLDFVQHIQHPWNQSQVCDLTFTCKKKYADSFNHFFESHHQTITVNFMNTNVVKICLIGPGIKEKYLSIIHDITDILESLGQILYGIHVSEVRLMMVINQENFAKVLQHLHAHFRLDTLFQAA
jgi:aspartate kinase